MSKRRVSSSWVREAQTHHSPNDHSYSFGFRHSSLLFLGFPDPLAQVRLNERLELAVKHAAGVVRDRERAMVLDALGGVQLVGANRPASEADLRLFAALGRQLGVALLLLALVQLGDEHLARHRAILVLAALVLALHDGVCGQVRKADRGRGLVYV